MLYQLADDFCRSAEEVRRYEAFIITRGHLSAGARSFFIGNPVNDLAFAFYLQPPRLPEGRN